MTANIFSSWQLWAGLSAVFAALTAIFAKVGVENVNSDLATFIRAAEPGKDRDNGRVTGWTWKPVPPPALASLPPRAQAWERTRYHAYYAQLARRTLGEVFRRAATFLALTAANAGPLTDLSSADTHNGLDRPDGA